MAAVLGPSRAEETKYPLTTCVVSGEKLGSMGEPYVFTYEGTEVRLCCDHCKPKFDENAQEYLKKIPAKKNSE